MACLTFITQIICIIFLIVRSETAFIRNMVLTKIVINEGGGEFVRDISKAFGIAISDARRKCGLRQVDLAEELGKTNRCISDLENGKTMPRLDTVAQFARRLGISIDEVIHDEPQAEVPLCAKQFFAGMSEEVAAKYIRLCIDAKDIPNRTEKK